MRPPPAAVLRLDISDDGADVRASAAVSRYISNDIPSHAGVCPMRRGLEA
jgi:hypothetical protein